MNEPETIPGSSARQRDPVARAFRVLRRLAAEPAREWGLREIAKGTAMHPSTVHRTLGSLLAEGLVEQEPATARYRLGLEFQRLAWRTSSRESLRELALPALRRLEQETEETANLGVYGAARGQMMLIASVESRHAVRSVRPLYEWMPVHGGATGRALLAHLAETERSSILGARLPALTERTPTDPGALERDLAEVRRRGYALSRGERVPGGVGVAAPVLGRGGRALAVVGITMPEQRFRARDERRLASLVKRAAAEIASALGLVERYGSAGAAEPS